VWLGTIGVPNEVFISCIESPYQGLEYLKLEGIRWNPDVVILGVTLGNDISQDYISLHPRQIGFQNDLEIYDLPESSLSPRKGLYTDLVHFLTHLRVVSLLSPKSRYSKAWYGFTKNAKMFDAAHGLGFYIRNTPEIIKKAYARHLEVLEMYANFCRNNNIKFAVLLFPQRFQIQPADWHATVRHYRLREESFDLDLPNRIIKTFCNQKGILIIDPTEYMRALHAKSHVEMYLPNGDMHWNEDGHYGWFSGAKQDFRRLLSPPSDNRDTAIKN
jgi:hypothetical protein